jgi:hypothetical protein
MSYLIHPSSFILLFRRVPLLSGFRWSSVFHMAGEAPENCSPTRFVQSVHDAKRQSHC